MATTQLLHHMSHRISTVKTTTNHHLTKTQQTPLSLVHFHPLKTPFTKLNPPPKPLKKPTHPIITMSSSSSITPVTDRLISAVGYTLPFFNSLHYGRFLLAQYPSLTILFQPILPLLSIYKSLPYANFIAFFGLYLGVVRNPSLSNYVRFNAMQALVLDVLLVLPVLLQRILSPGSSGLGFKVMVMGHNALFVFVFICFVYSFVSSILGRTPYLPFVADAAGRQI